MNENPESRGGDENNATDKTLASGGARKSRNCKEIQVIRKSENQKTENRINSRKPYGGNDDEK